MSLNQLEFNKMSIAKAIFSLGECYEEGRGYERNLDEAIHLYQKAASLKYPKAINKLGDCYFSGIGVKEDKCKATNLYIESVNLGDPDGMHRLACCYKFRDAQDLKKAFKLFQKAVDLGHINAIAHLGVCYLHGEGVSKNVEMAFSLFQRGANLEDFMAMCYLAHCFANGFGTDKSIPKALEWLEKASVCHHVSVIFSSARVLLYAENGPINPVKAVSLLEEAIQLGSIESLIELANCCIDGIGTQKDIKKAAELLQTVFEKRNQVSLSSNDTAFFSEVLNKLSHCYAQGDGIAQNVVQAIKLMRSAAQINKFEKPLSEELGILYRSTQTLKRARQYQEGIEGQEKDEGKAFELYQQSAEMGNGKAMNNLAYCYATGVGTKVNYKKAFFYFLQAALLDIQEAIFNLGFCFENGYGTPMDKQQASELYELARIKEPKQKKGSQADPSAFL